MREEKTLVDMECPICGKTFFVFDTETWAFRELQNRAWRYYCGWHCICDARRQAEAGRHSVQKRSHEIRLDKGRRVAEMQSIGADMDEITRTLGVSKHTAYSAKADWKKER